jgi:hypothetical protein
MPAGKLTNENLIVIPTFHLDQIREEHVLKASENRELRTIFGLKENC